MDLANRVIVVTEGGTGVGRALAARFARERPRREMPQVGGRGDDDVRCLLGPGGRALDPATVADIVVTGLRTNRFLVLTRPESKERALLRVTHPDDCPDDTPHQSSCA